MSLSRRNFIGALASLGAIAALPTSVMALTARDEKILEGSTPSEKINITLPAIADNARSQSITVDTDHLEVSRIDIFVEGNEHSHQVSADFTKSMHGYLSTNIEVEQSSYVTVRVVSQARTFHKTVYIKTAAV